MADMTDFEIKTGNFHEAARGLILAIARLFWVGNHLHMRGVPVFSIFAWVKIINLPKWMVEVLDVEEQVAAHFSKKNGAPEIMNPDPFH